MPNDSESSEGPLARETEKTERPLTMPAKPDPQYQEEVERHAAAWHNRYE